MFGAHAQASGHITPCGGVVAPRFINFDDARTLAGVLDGPMPRSREWGRSPTNTDPEGTITMNNLVLQVLTRLQTIELRDEKGQTLAEYGLILALIAAACIVALTGLGGAIAARLTGLAGDIN